MMCLIPVMMCLIIYFCVFGAIVEAMLIKIVFFFYKLLIKHLTLMYILAKHLTIQNLTSNGLFWLIWNIATFVINKIYIKMT